VSSQLIWDDDEIKLIKSVLNPTWAGFFFENLKAGGLLGPRVIYPEWDMLETW